MEFKYYVYLIVGTLIVLMAIYILLTYLFPSIRLKKEVVEIEFSETLVIPELAELGAFTYSRHDKELQNEIVIPFWTSFKIDPKEVNAAFDLNFDSDDKKLNPLQIKTYKSIVQYTEEDWQNIVSRILAYYKKNYSQLEELQNLAIEGTEDLKRAIQLNSILIHSSGSVGMSFNCIWDEEHGLGVNFKNNNEIVVGEAAEAY